MASALSCLTATSTDWPSLSGRGDPSPRDSGSPSASHKWTWRTLRVRFCTFYPFQKLLQTFQDFPARLHCSPLQTAPPPASPWRWAAAAGTRRRRCPSWWESPRWGRGRRTCCCRWRPAAARCPSLRSAVRCYGNTDAACTGWCRAQRSLLHTLKC